MIFLESCFRIFFGQLFWNASGINSAKLLRNTFEIFGTNIFGNCCSNFSRNSFGNFPINFLATFFGNSSWNRLRKINFQQSWGILPGKSVGNSNGSSLRNLSYIFLVIKTERLLEDFLPVFFIIFSAIRFRRWADGYEAHFFQCLLCQFFSNFPAYFCYRFFKNSSVKPFGNISENCETLMQRGVVIELEQSTHLKILQSSSF